MRFEKIFLEWALWALVFSLLLGGTPWMFPSNGEFWIEKFKAQRPHLKESLLFQ
jgi:hypothetical protein